MLEDSSTSTTLLIMIPLFLSVAGFAVKMMSWRARTARQAPRGRRSLEEPGASFEERLAAKLAELQPIEFEIAPVPPPTPADKVQPDGVSLPAVSPPAPAARPMSGGFGRRVVVRPR